MGFFKFLKELFKGKTKAEKIGKQTLYKPKKYLMTKVESILFDKIKNVLPNEYILQPQVNLGTIISKVKKSKYQNELFRNIDFGIFNKKDYSIKLLIECNDRTHEDKKRKERDSKVKFICDDAGIKLITFWTNYENKESYIKERIFKELNII